MTDGLKTLHKSSVRGAHPLRHILVDGITHWITTGKSDYKIPIKDYPTHMQDVVHRIEHEQGRIGWDNAIKGFLSKSWISLASMSYEEGEKVSSNEGAHRLQESIKALYTYTIGLWTARNAALHDDDHNQEQRSISRMQDTIRYLHQHPEGICFDDRYLCDMSLAC